MNKDARVVIIDEYGPPRVSVEPRTMANIHRIIGCDTVDHATIRINGFKFNALVDDSGILNGRKIMAISPEGLKLYGTIWIEPYDDERFSLEDPEIESILDSFRAGTLLLGNTKYWRSNV